MQAKEIRDTIETEYAEAGLEIQVFTTGEELGNAINKRPCDILIMDIVLGNAENGINLVREFQETNAFLQTIYVSAYPEYHMDVYETDHIYFISKPIRRDMLSKALSKASQNLKALDNAFLTLGEGQKLTKIHMRDIIMVESVSRKIQIHCSSGLLETYGKLSGILTYLDKRFIQCHQSYIVNMDHIIQYDTSEICLTLNKKAFISQRRKAETRNTITRYLGGKLC